jgi:hypothetical protein
MTNPAWTAAALDEARRCGDAVVDPMASRIYAGAHHAGAPGRLGYLRLLDLADRLLEAPELYLAHGSQIRHELDALPEELRTYFDPVVVPEWVDAELLAIASRIWDENMLVIIWVLYAASLPSCYLIAKGIPALYDSGKLGEKRYIDQRIYETGLMLEAVMEPGGLSIVNDASADGKPSAQRFMWGRGVIAARKVRMLHAAMRHLLTHPSLPAAGAGGGAAQRMTVLKPYDVAALGEPVNQEDLAYTLLTFGYAIPRGLAAWGCRLSARENEAFLHAWRVVAHLMGVSAALVPTSWAEAGELFAIIQGRQKAASEMGRTLTGTLTGFLGDYLPVGLRATLPAMLIRSQLGTADAALILPPETATPGPLLRAAVAISLLALRAYFLLADFLVWAVPALGALLGDTFRDAGNALVDSWRDDYQRLPFYIPTSADAPWTRQPGVDAALQGRLQQWRARMFYTVVCGIVLVVAATMLGACWAVLVPLRASGGSAWLGRLGWGPLLLSGAAIAALYLGGIVLLQKLIARQVDARPGPPPPAPAASITRVAVRRQRRRR